MGQFLAWINGLGIGVTTLLGVLDAGGAIDISGLTIFIPVLISLGITAVCLAPDLLGDILGGLS